MYHISSTKNSFNVLVMFLMFLEEKLSENGALKTLKLPIFSTLLAFNTLFVYRDFRGSAREYVHRTSGQGQTVIQRFLSHDRLC